MLYGGSSMLALKLLILLFAANSAPVITVWLLNGRWQWPVDGGKVCFDGRRWLGDSKTWRGLIAASVLTVAVALPLGFSVVFAFWFGVASMAGDLLSSFTKRRMGKPPSSQAILLDQLPEALLPMVLAHLWLGLDWMSVLIVTLAFTLAEMLGSPVLYRMGLRKKPY